VLPWGHVVETNRYLLMESRFPVGSLMMPCFGSDEEVWLLRFDLEEEIVLPISVSTGNFMKSGLWSQNNNNI
jgi:hypothetical protein